MYSCQSVFTCPSKRTSFSILNYIHVCRQKWLHVASISLLLRHDVPVGRHLHIPSPSSRYHVITCRQALLSVTGLLDDVTSFVLLETNTYVKFMHQ